VSTGGGSTPAYLYSPPLGAQGSYSTSGTSWSNHQPTSPPASTNGPVRRTGAAGPAYPANGSTPVDQPTRSLSICLENDSTCPQSSSTEPAAPTAEDEESPIFRAGEKKRSCLADNICAVGEDAFLKDVAERWIEIFSKNPGPSLLNLLRLSGAPIEIRDNEGGGNHTVPHTFADRRDGWIVLYDRSDRDVGGVPRPTFIGLVHELLHIRIFILGLGVRRPDHDIVYGITYGPISPGEISENAFRSAHGVPLISVPQ
jgi:hypothetical protein